MKLRTRSITLLAITIVAASIPAQETASPPSWTNSSGVAIVGEFVRLEAEVLVIRKNGKDFRVPLAGLSLQSREQARSLAGQAASNRLLPVPQDGSGTLIVAPLTEGGKPPPMGLGSLSPKIASLSNVVRVSVSGHHALALSSEGKVFSWGRQAEDLPPLPPEMMGTTKKVVQIIAGKPDAVLLEDGTVILSADTAQLSIPDDLKITRIEGIPPTLYAFDSSSHITYIGPRSLLASKDVPAALKKASIRSLAVSAENTMAIPDSGEPVVWGSNAPGFTVIPDELRKRASKGEKMIALRMGLIVLDTGKPIMWGGGANSWQVDPKARFSNATGVILLQEGYWNALVIRRQRSDSVRPEFEPYANNLHGNRDAYLEKLFNRHAPYAVAGGAEALVMISSRK